MEGGEGIVPVLNSNGNRDRTTVRIRNKNNQFTFVEGNFNQPLDGRGGPGNMTTTNNNRSYLNDQSQ